jgi:hypothetical protein
LLILAESRFSELRNSEQRLHTAHDIANGMLLELVGIVAGKASAA